MLKANQNELFFYSVGLNKLTCSILNREKSGGSMLSLLQPERGESLLGQPPIRKTVSLRVGFKETCFPQIT